ncbi:MAG: hypothetical protein KF774_11245 [Planctomyces sp.]|nr:hypothetical protein [Planctomyces sp.]
MSGNAQVQSIPALRELQAALASFRDDASSSLDMMLMELQRAVDWIEHDRPAYWQLQTRRAFEQVAATRTALNTCQMRTVAGRRPSCIEEKEAYAAARRRLQHCQEQVERVKRWSIKVRHEVDEFRSRLSALRRRLDGELPKSVAALDRMAAALEEYAGLVRESSPPAAPSAEDPAG